MKISEVTLYKENAFKGNSIYNVRIEGDERRFSYICKTPKLKVGDTNYTLEEKSKDGKTWWTIKPKVEEKAWTANWKPNYVIALEWARKMYNSSYSTHDPWTIIQLTKMADWLLLAMEKYDTTAIDTAVTIQCASAVDRKIIDTKALAKHVTILDKWIKARK